jgi:hypothetical protein
MFGGRCEWEESLKTMAICDSPSEASQGEPRCMYKYWGLPPVKTARSCRSLGTRAKTRLHVREAPRRVTICLRRYSLQKMQGNHKEKDNRWFAPSSVRRTRKLMVSPIARVDKD